jgi:hypothetical protein|tara:strand:+ start:418 stop:546 length:129 start_codon:yes stop_codon:yes gene_type:complete
MIVNSIEELDEAMRHKLEHHFDEQEALKEAIERRNEEEGDDE